MRTVAVLVLSLLCPGTARAGVVLEGPAWVLAGEPAPYTISGEPGQVQLWRSEVEGGPALCPHTVGACLDLSASGELVASGHTRRDGSSRFALSFPTGGGTVWLQGAVQRGRHPALSDVLAVRVLAPEADEDGDLLSNADEVALGTDPFVWDTDGGGVGDGEEVWRGTNPFDAWDDVYSPPYDSDGDGLSDDDEAAWGTDPYNSDTDGDTVPDGDEVNAYGTDPTSWDTDGGGVSDGEEIYWQGTDPHSAYDDIDSWSRDSDGDGLYDAEEQSVWGTDPWSWDTDGGGVGDGEEVWRGTNPSDPWDDAYSTFYDSDGDGLSDEEEWGWATDPSNPDTDGDGLLDGDEIYYYGTDATTWDTDGGGVGDGDELWRGSDPWDPSDDQP